LIPFLLHGKSWDRGTHALFADQQSHARFTLGPNPNEHSP